MPTLRTRLAAAATLATALAASTIPAGAAPVEHARPTSADAATQPTVERISGPTRWDTAAWTVDHRQEAATDAIVVAGDNWPDALAAAPAAARLGVPLLLTAADHTPTATSELADRLGLQTITLVGGPAAVADSGDIADRTDRLHGPTRQHTAATVASTYWSGGADTVVLVSADTYADALAGSSLAVTADAPILLTDPDRLTDVTTDALTRLDPDHIVLVGGGAALDDTVARQARQHAEQVSRLGGADRYATAVAVADHVRALHPGSNRTVLASGTTFVDALAGANLLQPGTRLLLTRPDQLPSATAGALAGTRHLMAIGGTDAVAGHVVTQATAKAGLDHDPWVARINQWRGAAGVPPVSHDPSRATGAQLYARFMARADSAGIGADGEPRPHHIPEWHDEYTPTGATAAGRSVALLRDHVPADVDMLVDAFIGAPYHAVTLLNPELGHVGAGAATDMAGPTRYAAAIDIGRRDQPDVDYIFPADGATIPTGRWNGREWPDPTAADGPCPDHAGFPIVVHARGLRDVRDVELAGADGPVPVCTITVDNGQGVLWYGHAIVFPEPVLGDGQYTATATPVAADGTPGSPLTSTFTVQTGTLRSAR